jgi:hypothetical protein
MSSVVVTWIIRTGAVTSMSSSRRATLRCRFMSRLAMLIIQPLNPSKAPAVHAAVVPREGQRGTYGFSVGSAFGLAGMPVHWTGGDEPAWGDAVGRGLVKCSDPGLQAGPAG